MVTLKNRKETDDYIFRYNFKTQLNRLKNKKAHVDDIMHVLNTMDDFFTETYYNKSLMYIQHLIGIALDEEDYYFLHNIKLIEKELSYAFFW